MADKIMKDEREWRSCLNHDQFRVLRQKGTEHAFTGAFWDSRDPAMYTCAGCGQPLFDSETKFDSGTGWPSFFRPVDTGVVSTEVDVSLDMRRTEVHCSRCGGHLGHVFPDGPAPTGMRYCINSAALDQKKR
jgi:peptide-methionine (R)-S-oxide reductase